MLKETSYKSKSRGSSLRLLKEIFNDFPTANALGYSLAHRNIKAKYRQSLLGILWAVFPPLALASVWIVLNSQGLVSFNETGVPYPLFVITGTFLWQSFTLSVTTFLQGIQTNKSILVKINFPREAIFYSTLYETLFYILISFIPVVIVFFLYGFMPGIGVLYFLLFLLNLILLGLVIGLLIFPVASLFKDITFGLPMVLQLALYLTPVIYPLPVYKGLGNLLALNPVTPLLVGARAGLLGTSGIPAWDTILIFIIVLISLLILGLLLMRITMEILIERMGS